MAGSLKAATVEASQMGAAKVWRTTFRHLHSRACKIAGLFHGRINARVGSQLCGRREALDITTDFRKNDGGQGGPNARNGGELRVKSREQTRDFRIKDSDRGFQRTDLFDILPDDERKACPEARTMPKEFFAAS